MTHYFGIKVDTHIAICSELFTTDLPFNQAILQSGVATLSVRSLEHQQALYEKIVDHLKIEADKSPKERLQDLREVPADDLVNSYISLGTPVPSWQATVDGYFLKGIPTVSNLPLQKYPPSLKRVLIGDCAAEGLIFADRLNRMGWSFGKLELLFSKVLGEKRGQEVLQAYGMSENSSTEDLFLSLINFLTDAEWSQPIQAVAKSFSNGDVFYYHMAEGNPFDGANKGKSNYL